MTKLFDISQSIPGGLRVMVEAPQGSVRSWLDTSEPTTSSHFEIGSRDSKRDFSTTTARPF